MGMISPQQLYDDPKLWLQVDHQFHDVLGKLMTKMFPDWPSKLAAIECHCLECEGKRPVIVIVRTTGKPGICVGYVEKPERLLQIREVNINE